MFCVIIAQMAGIGRCDPPDGYDPPITRESKPSCARCSMPLTPYISPAAIGCSIVRSRGWPVARKWSPIAAIILSGQPKADDDDTVTTAPSLICAAATAGVTSFDML